MCLSYDLQLAFLMSSHCSKKRRAYPHEPSSPWRPAPRGTVLAGSGLLLLPQLQSCGWELFSARQPQCKGNFRRASLTSHCEGAACPASPCFVFARGSDTLGFVCFVCLCFWSASSVRPRTCLLFMVACHAVGRWHRSLSNESCSFVFNC